MSVTAAKWTLEEYHHMIKAGILDDRQVELLRGEIVEMSPEWEPHAYSRNEAAEYLAKLLGDQAKVRQDSPITLPNNSEAEPDIAVVQNLGREYLFHHPYPENIFWVIEYSQTSLNKDLEIKSKIYAEIGIPEYWVVNLNELQLVVFRYHQNGEYASKQTFTSGTIQPLAFSDVIVSINLILNS
ncbi:Uma2 family endonuclease [Nostoc sp. CHAB 5834]|nr:Uma2 family endonuclease [Nostoc sp. CHAB 5834]